MQGGKAPRRTSQPPSAPCPPCTPACRQAANAFCAVRPPGHHAGPLGVVSNSNDPNGRQAWNSLLEGVAEGALGAPGRALLPAAPAERQHGRWCQLLQLLRPPNPHTATQPPDRRRSHGFCLFNNAAVGAAYAMNVYRHAGVRRVAILDFDVHHGNGTGAFAAIGCKLVGRGRG